MEMNYIEMHSCMLTDDEAKAAMEAWANERCKEWNMGKEWIAISDDDIFFAARELQYAIRWFFHVFVSKHFADGYRWQYIYWRYKVISIWENYYSPVHIMDYALSCLFWKRILTGMKFLKDHWQWK
jgi:hypothetical protein